jgi:chorismate synthase
MMYEMMEADDDDDDEDVENLNTLFVRADIVVVVVVVVVVSSYISVTAADLPLQHNKNNIITKTNTQGRRGTTTSFVLLFVVSFYLS